MLTLAEFLCAINGSACIYFNGRIYECVGSVGKMYKLRELGSEKIVHFSADELLTRNYISYYGTSTY